MSVEYASRTLAQLVVEADDGQILLPNFQRQFVWSADAHRSLAASVLINIPCGSLLLVKGKTDDFSSRRVGFNHSDTPPDIPRTVSISSMGSRGSVRFVPCSPTPSDATGKSLTLSLFRSCELDGACVCDLCGRMIRTSSAGQPSISVRGREKVPTGGQVEVPTGGRIEVPTPCSSCRSGTFGPSGDGEGANHTPHHPGSSIEVCEGPYGHHFHLSGSRVVPRSC